MNSSAKKAIIILSGSGLVFLLLKYVFPVKAEGLIKLKEEGKLAASGGHSAPQGSDKRTDAMVILRAFHAAIKDKQPASFLNQMNIDFMKEYKMKVHKSKSAGKFFVADAEGNVILE